MHCSRDRQGPGSAGCNACYLQVAVQQTAFYSDTLCSHDRSFISVCRWLCSGRSSDLGRCSVEGAFELDCLAHTMRLAEERGCNCSFEVKLVDGLPAARQQNRWADTCSACSALILGQTMGCAAKGWGLRRTLNLQTRCSIACHLRGRRLQMGASVC